ncbi:helix-turn-helix domain-containing protein [Bdellovibrionota bacterium]
MTDLNRQNYYEILEIKPNVSQKEVTKSYLRLKNAYSKDSIASYTILSDEQRETILKKIEEAYLVLSSTMKRKEYDIEKGFVKKRVHRPIIRGAVVRRHGTGRHRGVQTEPEDLYEHIRSRRKGWQKRGKRQRGRDFAKDPEMERRIAEQDEYSGKFLREIREYRKIDLEEVSNSTKIALHFLKALEEEAFSEFTAPVYIRGFLAQYARFLGLDPIRVCQSYLGRLKEAEKVKEAK